MIKVLETQIVSSLSVGHELSGQVKVIKIKQ